MTVVIDKRLDHVLEFLVFSGRDAAAKSVRDNLVDGEVDYIVVEEGDEVGIPLKTNRMSEMKG